MVSKKAQKSVAGLLLLAASHAHAEAPAATSQAPVPVEPKRFSIDAVVEATSSLHRFDDPNHAAELDYILAPSIALSGPLMLSGKFMASQDLEGDRELLVQNGSLSLRHSGARLGSALRLSPALGVGLPLSKRSFRQESLILSGNLGSRLIFLGDQTPLKGFTAFLDLTGSRSMHQFTTSTTGSSNAEWGASARFYAEYRFLGRFSASGDFVRKALFTYTGKAQNKFDFTQELAFQASPAVALAVGHNNGGSTLKANQLDSNVKFFDENNSTVYGSLTLTY